MLFDPKGRILGDINLNKKEALIKLKEDTDRQLKSQRIADQEAFTDVDRRMGKGMLHTELYERVRKLNPNILMETSNNDSSVAGFYVVRNGQKEFVCAFHKGYLPEFSIVTVDARNLPVSERRGWRTVLLRLLAKRCLTLDQINAAFGPVTAQDERGKYWKLFSEGF